MQMMRGLHKKTNALPIHTNTRESPYYNDVSEKFIYFLVVGQMMMMISENRPKQWIDKDILN